RGVANLDLLNNADDLGRGEFTNIRENHVTDQSGLSGQLNALALDAQICALENFGVSDLPLADAGEDDRKPCDDESRNCGDDGGNGGPPIPFNEISYPSNEISWHWKTRRSDVGLQ